MHKESWTLSCKRCGWTTRKHQAVRKMCRDCYLDLKDMETEVQGFKKEIEAWDEKENS